MGLVLGGLLGGLLGGPFSTPGPPNMVFVLAANVGKDEWRSSQAVAGVVQMPTRLVALLVAERAATGAAGLEGLCQPLVRLLPQCMVSFCFGLLGLCTGNMVAHKVSEALFRRYILVLLLEAGLVLLMAGLGRNVAGAASASAFVLVCCVSRQGAPSKAVNTTPFLQK